MASRIEPWPGWKTFSGKSRHALWFWRRGIRTIVTFSIRLLNFIILLWKSEMVQAICYVDNILICLFWSCFILISIFLVNVACLCLGVADGMGHEWNDLSNNRNRWDGKTLAVQLEWRLARGSCIRYQFLDLLLHIYISLVLVVIFLCCPRENIVSTAKVSCCDWLSKFVVLCDVFLFQSEKRHKDWSICIQRSICIRFTSGFIMM